MARPQKEGLTYFPLDVDIDQDDKLIVPIAKHGMVGFGVVVKLMMEIYKNGYFYPWTEKEKYVFPFKIGVETDKACEIVIDCINSGFFCKNQYNRNQILTSYGFQKRFLMASTRRKESTINPLYLAQKELSHTETELLHAETQEMSAISTQSKVKESKGNKDTTTDDFEVIRVRFRELHGIMDIHIDDSPVITKLLDDGIPRSTIIKVLESRFKPTARTIKYYDAAIREAHQGVVAVRQIKKHDPELESRKIEIARNKWISEGNDPSGFIYKPASGD